MELQDFETSKLIMEIFSRDAGLKDVLTSLTDEELEHEIFRRNLSPDTEQLPSYSDEQLLQEMDERGFQLTSKKSKKDDNFLWFDTYVALGDRRSAINILINELPFLEKHDKFLMLG